MSVINLGDVESWRGANRARRLVRKKCADAGLSPEQTRKCVMVAVRDVADNAGPLAAAILATSHLRGFAPGDFGGAA